MIVIFIGYNGLVYTAWPAFAGYVNVLAFVRFSPSFLFLQAEKEDFLNFADSVVQDSVLRNKSIFISS